jgi:hypothetical protein
MNNINKIFKHMGIELKQTAEAFNSSSNEEWTEAEMLAGAVRIVENRNKRPYDPKNSKDVEEVRVTVNGLRLTSKVRDFSRHGIEGDKSEIILKKQLAIFPKKKIGIDLSLPNGDKEENEQ